MSAAIPFVKMQAVGNDFVLLDERQCGRQPYAELAIAMCDRHRGIGSDGLLVISPSAAADFRYQMFNPDGTEDSCGNGLRCVVKYWIERSPHVHEGVTRLRVEQRKGISPIRALVKGRKVRRVSAGMGRPSFDPRLIPLAADQEVIDKRVSVGSETFRMTCVNTGTANAVIFVRRSHLDLPIPAVSPQIERHSLFPERANVLWAYVRHRSQIEVAIWERGAGETLGCGTGACAAAVAAARLGLTDRKVTVVSRGGTLHVEWLESGDVILTGGAEEIFRGTWTAGVRPQA